MATRVTVKGKEVSITPLLCENREPASCTSLMPLPSSRLLTPPQDFVLTTVTTYRRQAPPGQRSSSNKPAHFTTSATFAECDADTQEKHGRTSERGEPLG